MDYKILYELVKTMKNELNDEEFKEKMEKLAYKDSSGLVNLDNFKIAAKNGASILDKPVF